MVIISHPNLDKTALCESILRKLKREKEENKTITNYYSILNIIVCINGISSWIANIKKNETILTGSSKMYIKMVESISQHKREIKYLENTVDLKKAKLLSIPSMKCRKNPTSYESIKKALNYLDPNSKRIMNILVGTEGSWFLQGYSGTGKSSLMKIFMVLNKADYVISYTRKYNIDEVIQSVEKFRLDHSKSSIFLVFEEIDRNLSLPKEMQEALINVELTPDVKTFAKDLLRTYFVDGLPRLFGKIDEIKTINLERKFDGEKRDCENWVSTISADLAVRYAALKTENDKLKAQIKDKKDTEKTNVNIELLKIVAESIHQFSLSFFQNVKIFMSTNSLLGIAEQDLNTQKSIETTFRPGRCNVIQFPYLTKEKLSEILAEHYNTKVIDEELLDVMMTCGFYKQYNLHIFLQMFTTYKESDVKEMIKECNAFKKTTTIDGFAEEEPEPNSKPTKPKCSKLTESYESDCE